MNARVPVFDTDQMLADVTKAWDDDIVSQITDYIEIPAKSPAFDAGWAKAGYLDLVVERAADWVRAQGVEGGLRAAEGERRGVAARARQLHGHRARAAAEDAAHRGDVGVLGLPEVHGRNRDPDWQARRWPWPFPA